MRAIDVTIWIFVNLVVLGMGGYIYLLWSQYKLYLERENPHAITTKNIYDQQIYYYNRGFLNDTKVNSERKRRKQPREIKNVSITLVKNSKPRFPNLQNKELELDNDRFKCFKDDSEDACAEKTANFKNELLYELRRVFSDESNVFKTGVETQNPYFVSYKGEKGNFMDKTAQELLCELKNVIVRSVLRNDSPFDVLDIGKYFPRKGLFEKKHFNSCAIISSAGSLKNSSLGTMIGEFTFEFLH